MLGIESSGGDRTRPLHTSGANGGSAAPRGDGLIRWWCPASEGEADDEIHEDEKCDGRVRPWAELTDVIGRTLLN
ncbi:MAG: hypothetical protein Q7S02_04975 [bacterium]|nr:hypothetical protein [bacterium]